MFAQLRTCVIIFVLLTILTGVVYPLAVTAVAYVAFPHQADGSVIEIDGKAVGSDLLGQAFDDPKYFWGRRSATGPYPYNAMGGSGANQGPTNPALIEAVRDRVAQLRAGDPGNEGPIPVDLATASASGLDPHISPAAAEYQVSRVARDRGLSQDQVRELVRQHTHEPTLGFLGQRRVHVLKLNLALDSLQK
jgi:K+-transporting ATPase ATPase C chain